MSKIGYWFGWGRARTPTLTTNLLTRLHWMGAIEHDGVQR
jgi:hypothetical protein